ncbi:aldo/keto reductase [Anaerotardibacter muris]|uniref:aldo/keto reductase n=1 Tax=Anaerotardibacter muris TaxID=2941505 RepID=UPI00203B4BF8|nr:aldo/keto reductase [Anaerotardibacter muris]
MEYRIDPKSGNELSILGFGCMRFPTSRPGKIDMLRTELLILEAIASGINYFDTAYLYAGSEEALGTILQKNSLREHVFIATKLPHTNCRSIEDVERCFQKSCERLKTDYIDYFLIHNVATHEQWKRLLEFGIEDWIAEKKRSGAIKQIGFSFHGSNPEFVKLIDAYQWDFCQIQYNYANEHYQAGRAGLDYAASKGLPIIIMEPLLGGRLVDRLPEKAKKVIAESAPAGTSETQAAVELALRWLWDQPEVTVVLSGMSTEQQLKDNIQIADSAKPGCFTVQEQKTLDEVLRLFNESFRVPCTGCNYCLPCPVGINIPSLFSAYNTSYSVNWFTGVMNYFMSVGSLGTDPHYASDCIECGACMKKCPQHIQIPDELKKVRRRLQPPATKKIMEIVSKTRL